MLCKSQARSYCATITRSAELAIQAEIKSARADFGEDLEVGGWLLSDVRWPDHIVLATDAGANSRHAKSSVALDFGRAQEFMRAFQHLSVRGCWHSHPSGDAAPSRADRRAWQRGWELTRDRWLGLIVTPGGWLSRPQLYCWRTISGFCEPLELEVR